MRQLLSHVLQWVGDPISIAGRQWFDWFSLLKCMSWIFVYKFNQKDNQVVFSYRFLLKEETRRRMNVYFQNQVEEAKLII